MVVVAFDPGGTTGYCIGSALDSSDFELASAGVFEWDDRQPAIKDILEAWSPDVIVIESFNLFNTHKEHLARNDFPAVRVIGAIEAHAYNLMYTPTIVFQSPASRKRVKIVHTLPNNTRHTKDAYQHLRLYFLNSFVKGGIGTS